MHVGSCTLHPIAQVFIILIHAPDNRFTLNSNKDLHGERALCPSLESVCPRAVP